LHGYKKIPVKVSARVRIPEIQPVYLRFTGLQAESKVVVTAPFFPSLCRYLPGRYRTYGTYR